jgi:DNA-binding NarL/FixJ family response regulator
MRIIIVDDHVLFREGLAAIIRSEPEIVVVGMAGSVTEAVRLVEQERPDLVLMDFGLPDGTGVDATQAILKIFSDCKIIFLTMAEDDASLIAAIRSGAKGYLLKNMRPANLVSALWNVYNGESALSPSMTLRVMQELTHTHTLTISDPGLDRLTQREKEVLQEIGAGFSNQEIADHLFLSENTIKHHLHSIFEKLQVTDRKTAAAYARQHGLVK